MGRQRSNGTDLSEAEAKDFAYVLRKPCDSDRLVTAVAQRLRRAAGGLLLPS